MSSDQAPHDIVAAARRERDDQPDRPGGKVCALSYAAGFEGADKDEGGRVSQEFEECACAHSSWRTPDAMQRSGSGSKTKDDPDPISFCLLLFALFLIP